MLHATVRHWIICPFSSHETEIMPGFLRLTRGARVKHRTTAVNVETDTSGNLVKRPQMRFTVLLCWRNTNRPVNVPVSRQQVGS